MCTVYWWDHEGQHWTQEAEAPSLFGLRQAISDLRSRGFSAVSMLVVNYDEKVPDTARISKYLLEPEGEPS